MFILYSLVRIPPKRSEGKVSQVEERLQIPLKNRVEVSNEFDPESLIRRKTSRRKVVKKKATISVAEEEAAAREVHDTHARIVTKSVPEPARTIRQSNIAFRDTSSVSIEEDFLVRIPKSSRASISYSQQTISRLTVMKALKDSKKMIRRQPGTGGSDKGTGEIP
ncbi:hypothetical protein Tco_0422916 [Tanacetum coccineum]